MWMIFFSNLPELILGATWSGLVFFVGYRTGRWRRRK